MATLRRIAPILSVRDLGVALEFYRRLGFAVRSWDAGYGFATRDGLELHLGVVPAGDHHAGSAYLFVDDSEALAAEWRRVGVEVHAPEDTEWNQHEGAVADPDGNVLRFGSPVRKRRSSAI